jgi:hypothetical protein
VAQESDSSKDMVREDDRWKVLVVLTHQTTFPSHSMLPCLSVGPVCP